MKIENYLNKKITVQKIKSGLKLNDRQKSTLKGLGLRKIKSQSKLVATQPIIGMIKKVAHIVKIIN
jgi:large subunit ribosomal protein L30